MENARPQNANENAKYEKAERENGSGSGSVTESQLSTLLLSLNGDNTDGVGVTSKHPYPNTHSCRVSGPGLTLALTLDFTLAITSIAQTSKCNKQNR